ncbi:MAG TPA: CoA transferase, partial [Polyangiaceae bacterium]
MSALEGVRVLDLSRLLPGPFASLVLADLGARVDKIEDTDAGDYLRHMPPLVGDTSAMFLALNRSKRSACLDLKKPEARDAFLKLVDHYDVLLEQFRPKVMDRLGLSHAALLERNPKLVICALTGYGQTGPLAMRAGHDIDYLARAGARHYWLVDPQLRTVEMLRLEGKRYVVETVASNGRVRPKGFVALS